MIRLFVGIDLPENIKEHLYSLRGGLIGANWRTPERMHITLRFIGNVTEDVANEISKELKYLRFPAFHTRAKALGYFDVGNMPHHLWAGLDNDQILQELHDKLDSAIKRAGGQDQSSYKFLPHITLAKLQGTTMNDVYEYISANNLFSTEEFLVDNVTLYASIARENGEGKYYKALETYPLSLV